MKAKQEQNVQVEYFVLFTPELILSTLVGNEKKSSRTDYVSRLNKTEQTGSDDIDDSEMIKI